MGLRIAAQKQVFSAILERPVESGPLFTYDLPHWYEGGREFPVRTEPYCFSVTE
jgi:hypothetical protein